MVPAVTPGVVKNADGSIQITQSTAGNIDARVPPQFLGLANSRGFFQGQEGNSIYHSLQASVNHQWAGGLYFQAAYTWSKSIDNGSGSSFMDELNALLQWGDLLDQRGNRGPSDFDRTHRLAVSYNYELPLGRWARVENRGWGKLVHGWSINGVTIFQAGSPYMVFDGSAFLLQDTDFVNGTNKALLPAGTSLRSLETRGRVSDRVNSFLDLTRFIVGGQCVNNQNVVVNCGDPASTGYASLGNLGRNRFRGPFQQNWDMSFTKDTRVTERISVEFRAEFFNLWNHPSFQGPQAAGGPFGNYGLVDISTGDSSILATVNRPRIIQFALLFHY